MGCELPGARCFTAALWRDDETYLICLHVISLAVVCVADLQRVSTGLCELTRHTAARKRWPALIHIGLRVISLLLQVSCGGTSARGFTADGAGRPAVSRPQGISCTTTRTVTLLSLRPPPH